MDRTMPRKSEAIDRELAALMRHLPEPQPDPQTLGRIKAAMAAEARRLRRRQRWLSIARQLGAVAAAAVLVLLLSRGPRSSSPVPVVVEPDRELATWVEAADVSRQQVEALWTIDPLASLDPASDYDTPDVPLESLEESFESLERLIGT